MSNNLPGSRRPLGPQVQMVSVPVQVWMAMRSQTVGAIIAAASALDPMMCWFFVAYDRDNQAMRIGHGRFEMPVDVGMAKLWDVFADRADATMLSFKAKHGDGQAAPILGTDGMPLPQAEPPPPRTILDGNSICGEIWPVVGLETPAMLREAYRAICCAPKDHPLGEHRYVRFADLLLAVSPADEEQEEPEDD